jgi:hypothetical protein
VFVSVAAVSHKEDGSLQWFADLEPRYNGRPIWRSPHTGLLHCDGAGGVNRAAHSRPASPTFPPRTLAHKAPQPWLPS